MPQSAAETQDGGARPRGWKRLLQVLASMSLWVFAVFASAGTLNWDRGWICVATWYAGASTAGLLVRWLNPEVLEARAKFRRKDTKPFDKVFYGIFLPLTYIQPAIAGLDVVRFGWSSMPYATVYVGVALFAAGMGLATWVMIVNRHAETTVRIQNDRAHQVVSAGPYRIVRHPMYVGAIVMYLAGALIFGSFWALALSGAIAILFVWRTAMEDRTLRRELTGYEEFAASTRYRLIPGVW